MKFLRRDGVGGRDLGIGDLSRNPCITPVVDGVFAAPLKTQCVEQGQKDRRSRIFAKKASPTDEAFLLIEFMNRFTYTF